MNYEALNTTSYLPIAFIFAVFFMATVATFVASDSGIFFTKPWSYIAGISAVIFLGAAVAFAFMGDTVNNKNQEVATQNIMNKYEVKEVEWESQNTTSRPDGSTKEGTLLVTGNDGGRYVFQYEMNANTGEPTLKDMPIQGGNTPDKAKSSDALLKK